MESRERLCTNKECKKPDNPPDAEFCGGCGLPFVTEEPFASQNFGFDSIQEAQPIPTQDPMPGLPVEPPSDPDPDPAPAPPQPAYQVVTPPSPHRFKPQYIAFAIAGLIVLIGAALMIRWLSGRGGTTTNNNGTVADGPTKPIKLKLATYWRSDLPILADNVRDMAKDITDSSNGELQIDVLFAGEAKDSGGNVITPRDLFDAVSNNRVQMVHSAAYYWEDRIKGASFFSSVPFGMHSEQMESWIKEQDGLSLWRELYKPYKVFPLPCGHTGEQMGGWFDKEIKTVADFNGIKMRIPGLGGKVLERAGARTKPIPPQDIIKAKDAGEINAAEWIGAYHDTLLGLHEKWNYYYYPGWQEYDTMFELLINQDVYDKLPEHLRKLIESKSEEYDRKISRQFVVKNAEYEEILKKKNVRFMRFPNSVLARLKVLRNEVLKDYDRGDTQKIFRSYDAYQQLTSKEF